MTVGSDFAFGSTKSQIIRYKTFVNIKYSNMNANKETSYWAFF